MIDYVASQRAEQPILVVIGDGPERARLEQLAHRWQIDVRFLGNTPRREALAWIGAADELVHASIAEGMSTVVREAEQPRRQDHGSVESVLRAAWATCRGRRFGDDGAQNASTTLRPFSRVASVGSPHEPVGENVPGPAGCA